MLNLILRCIGLEALCPVPGFVKIELGLECHQIVHFVPFNSDPFFG
jgi:hypothetical protein